MSSSAAKSSLLWIVHNFSSLSLYAYMQISVLKEMKIKWEGELF